MSEGRQVETVDGIINEMQAQSGFDARDYVENIKNLWPIIAVSDLHLYATRIKEAHDREPELCGDVAQRALEYIKELEESNRKLMKETLGLYDCLKEAVADKCEQCKNSWYGKCVTADGKPCAVVAKWMDALKKAVGGG